MSRTTQVAPLTIPPVRMRNSSAVPAVDAPQAPWSHTPLGVVPANLVPPETKPRVAPGHVGYAGTARPSGTSAPIGATDEFCTPNAPTITPAPAGAVVLSTLGGRGGVVVQRGCTLRADCWRRCVEGWGLAFARES